MIHFKYYSRTYKINHEELIKDFTQVLTIPKFCLFINNIQSLPYYETLNSNDKKVLVNLAQRLVHTKILTVCATTNWFKPVKGYFPLCTLYRNRLPVEGKVFNDMVSKDSFEFKQTLKKLSKRIEFKECTPRDYTPSYHEDYVYSDANWSVKDASL